MTTVRPEHATTAAVPPRDLAAALRGAGLTGVDDSARRRAEYSADASNYRVVPSVVVFPRHVDEAAAALDVARRAGVPVTSRGAGTSIAGNAVGSGVVLDFSKHLNRVLSVDPAARTAVVEPGAILDDITAAVARHGLRFGPDPSTHSRASIGGSIGNNACGSRALRYGRTADNVLSLDVLTAAGERLTARRMGRDGLAAAGPALKVGAALDSLVGAHLDLIRTEFGRFTRQVSGYSLEHLLPENGADLAKFLAGTEGTLGMITGATVALVPSPKAVALAVLGYPGMPESADAVPGLLPHRPVALEGMDARLVGVFRARRGDAAVPALPRGQAWLFVETAGDTETEARAAAARLIADAGCLDSLVVTGGPARALWRVREDGAGLGSRTPADAPAWPGWEDAAVPPRQLGAYLRDFAALMTEHGLDGLSYGHFGDGCVHIRIDFPFSSAPARYRRFVVAAAQLVGTYGGSMSGEHGDGRARSELLPAMYSAEAIEVMAAVKAIFDPGNVLNPGVLVDPVPLDADLRVPQARPLARGLGFAYSHDGGDLSAAVHRCVGVGKCRADTTGSGGVMCPSWLATRDEKDSTRGRARVLQELANGSLVRGFGAAEVAESLDLCLSCKGCSSDCPAGVDMATYKAEVLYQRYRRRPRPPAHYSLGWLPRWARLASRVPGLANTALHAPGLAGLAKRLGGIDTRRPLPRFAAPTFRAWFAARPGVGVSQRAGTPVLLWVDTFTDYFTPEVGRAAVRVLEAAGYAVQITADPVCCGLTWISTGQLDGARRQLRRSLRALGPALDDGVPVVGLEPSCTAVLRGEITELLPDDPRASRAKAATRTLAELLTGTGDWAPPDLGGVRAVAQPHCHHHAVMGWHADSALLARAGAEVTAVGGCCGLAGNFGVERGHYDVSAAVAETALLPAVRAAGDAVVLADGFSCRTQLDQLAGVSGTHLAQLLASRLADPHARLPGYLMAWTCVVWATSRSAASYTLVWAVTVVRPRCSLVEGQAELPGERHQRHEGVQISGHDRRLQSTCIRRPAEPSGPMPGE
jgi:FAD/FMN-containing dehydrogenase/Fe-S oxidoreductase